MSFNIITVPHNEWFTANETVELVRRDYSAFNTGETPDNESEAMQNFVRDNLLAYWLMTNTWCLISQDIGGVGLAALLKQEIVEKGVSTTIKSSASLADSYVRSYHNGQLYHPCPSHQGRFFKELESLKFEEARQLLCYAKRFAPIVAKKHSKLAQKSIDSFLQVEKANRGHAKKFTDFVSTPTPIGSRARMWKVALLTARQLIRDICQDFPGFKRDSIPRMGPGAVRCVPATTYHKYEYLVRLGVHRPPFFLPMLKPVEDPDTVDTVRFSKEGKRKTGNLIRDWAMGRSPYPCITRITTVPKKVDTDRIVAPEKAQHQNNQLQVKDILEERIYSRAQYRRLMPIRNQEQQRERAMIAVLCDRLATLDFSHASDSVLKVMVQWLFPDDWWNAFLCCIPQGFILSEKDLGPQVLNAFATMGCGCTFVVESIVFASLMVGMYYALHYQAGNIRLSDCRDLTLNIPDDIAAMGDDCILPSWMVDEFSRFVEAFGFSINHEKSFLDGKFRESCGADWIRTDWGVKLVTPLYWPRIPVRGSWDNYVATTYVHYEQGDLTTRSCMSKIIALEHHLVERHYLSAARFLIEAVRSYAPHMSVTNSATTADDAADMIWPTNEWDRTNVKAVFVGVPVPDKYRRVGTDEFIPNGYVLRSAIVDFWQDRKACSNTVFESLYHRKAYTRTVRSRVALRGAPVPNDEIVDSVMNALRLELFLQRRSCTNNMFPAFSYDRPRSDHFCPDLAEAIGARPEIVSESELAGFRSAKIVFDLA